MNYILTKCQTSQYLQKNEPSPQIETQSDANPVSEQVESQSKPLPEMVYEIMIIPLQSPPSN